MDYQSEGTKLISMYPGGTYGGTIEVRTEVLAYGTMARAWRVAYGRLPMGERVGRAVSSE